MTPLHAGLALPLPPPATHPSGGYGIWACGCAPCYCRAVSAAVGASPGLRASLAEAALGTTSSNEAEAKRRPQGIGPARGASGASRNPPALRPAQRALAPHSPSRWPPSCPGAEFHAALCSELRGLADLTKLHARLKGSLAHASGGGKLGRRQRAVNLLVAIRARLDEAAARPRGPAPSVPLAGAHFPRRLFTFWDDAPMPEVVTCCLAIMRRRNPSWELTVLRPSHPGLPPPPVPEHTLTGAQLADWYRLAAISEHGGVYLDASCVTLGPLEAWVDVGSAAVQGFELVHDGDTMESWAIAAPRGAPFVRSWRDEFSRALLAGPKEYCARLSRAVITPGLEPSLPYLAIHAAWRLTKAAMPDAPLALRPANSPGGPYHYLASAGFDSLLATSTLFGRPQAGDLAATPLLKFRGAERDQIVPMAEYGRTSFLARELLGATTPSTVKERLAFLRCGLELPDDVF